MIIRRFFTALRQQDWAAVCIEIGVVTLGILIAITVDDYVNWRSDRGMEWRALEALQIDLRTSAADLQSDSESTRRSSDILREILDFDNPEDIPADLLQRLGPAANITAAYAPTIATYESLISTGTLSVIRSGEIRRALAAIDRDTEIYMDYRNQTTQVWLFTLMPVTIDTQPEVSSERRPLHKLKSARFREAIGQRATFLYFTSEVGARLAQSMLDVAKTIESDNPG